MAHKPSREELRIGREFLEWDNNRSENTVTYRESWLEYIHIILPRLQLVFLHVQPSETQECKQFMEGLEVEMVRLMIIFNRPLPEYRRMTFTSTLRHPPCRNSTALNVYLRSACAQSTCTPLALSTEIRLLWCSLRNNFLPNTHLLKMLSTYLSKTPGGTNWAHCLCHHSM